MSRSSSSSKRRVTAAEDYERRVRAEEIIRRRVIAELDGRG